LKEEDMPEQAIDALLGAPVATGDDPARAEGRRAGAQAVDAESLRSPSGDDDLHADPSLEGIPREVIENVGAYDTDSAGGCG
jgi:hypothetical protein